MGKYIRNYQTYGVGASMELKENKVFEYYWHAGLNSGVTKGTWEKSGRHIVFNSELQPTHCNYSIIVDSKEGNQDSISIRLVDNDKEAMVFVTVLLTKNDKVIFGTQTDFDGLAKLPKATSDNLKLIISFGSYGYENIMRDYPKDSYPFISIPDSTVGHYQFHINMGPSRLNFRYFTNEKWKYKNTKFVGVRFPFSKEEKKAPKVDFKRKNYRIVFREKKKTSDSTIIRVFDLKKRGLAFTKFYLYEDTVITYFTQSDIDGYARLPKICKDKNWRNIKIKSFPTHNYPELIISKWDLNYFSRNKAICQYDIDVFWLIPEKYEGIIIRY
ncbi:MAG: hypothetical protein P8I93_02440 [Crocinitomicaceae bacterium]|nr:hypothetical protein [Crocinitomicaceae bacterium]